MHRPFGLAQTPYVFYTLLAVVFILLMLSKIFSLFDLIVEYLDINQFQILSVL